LNAGWTNQEKAVFPFVCQQVHGDKTEERSVQIFILHWWGVTPSTWNFGSTSLHWSKIADFERYSLIAPQP